MRERRILLQLAFREPSHSAAVVSGSILSVVISAVTDVTSSRIELANLYLWRTSAGGADEQVDLTPKTFDVLRYLVEHPGRLGKQPRALKSLQSDMHAHQC